MNALAFAAILFADPWPQLPPEHVCRERYYAAREQANACVVHGSGYDCRGILAEIRDTWGASAAENIEARYGAWLEEREQSAQELAAFWWDAWWVRWDRASLTERMDHAARCQQFLGDLWYCPDWWRE